MLRCGVRSVAGVVGGVVVGAVGVGRALADGAVPTAGGAIGQQQCGRGRRHVIAGCAAHWQLTPQLAARTCCRHTNNTLYS